MNLFMDEDLAYAIANNFQELYSPGIAQNFNHVNHSRKG